MSAISMMVGATGPSGATFTVKVDNGPVRVAVADNDTMTSPVFFGPEAVDAQGVAKVVAAGLDPDTRYWWQVEDGGVLDTSTTGQFLTHPPVGDPASFSVGFSGDAGLDPDYPDTTGQVLAPNRISNSPIFDTIRQKALAEDWLFVGHLGDKTYYDPGTGVHVPDASVATYRRLYDDVLRQTNQAALYRDVALVEALDDHDWGGDNSDGTFVDKANIQQVFRERSPHYPLPDPDALYHPFQIGRVLFVVADCRSDRSPNTDPDGPSKTMLGAAQKAWMENLLTTTDAEFFVWALPSQWMGVSADSYAVFQTEQQELIDMFVDLNWYSRMCIVSADIHELGIDSGGNSPGGIPVFQFASFDARSNPSHDRYDKGPSIPGRNQYGRLDIADDGNELSVTGTAWIGTTMALSHTVTAFNPAEPTGIGWLPISEGTHSGGAFTIPVPPGVYSRLRLALYGHLDGIGTVRLRINNDTSAGHRTAATAIRASDGTINENDESSSPNQWILAHWASTAGNNATVELFATDVEEAVSYHSDGGRVSAGAGMWSSDGYGRLNANRLVNGLNLRPFSESGGTPTHSFGNLRWWLEGYRSIGA